MICSKTCLLALLNLTALLCCIYPWHSLAAIVILITFILISKTSFVVEEEVIDDKCYRRMDEEAETTIYIAVPLRVV